MRWVTPTSTWRRRTWPSANTSRRWRSSPGENLLTQPSAGDWNLARCFPASVLQLLCILIVVDTLERTLKLIDCGDLAGMSQPGTIWETLSRRRRRSRRRSIPTRKPYHTLQTTRSPARGCRPSGPNSIGTAYRRQPARSNAAAWSAVTESVVRRAQRGYRVKFARRSDPWPPAGFTDPSDSCNLVRVL